MKKYIIALALASGLVGSVQAQSLAFSQTIAAGGFSQVTVPNGSFKLLSVVMSSTNNATGELVDTATNSLTYVTPSFTSVTSYATNYVTYYTNYYGVVTTNTGGTSLAGSAFSGTNIALVSVTNTVASTTNNLPVVNVACTTTPLVINNMNTMFYRGIWFTNTGSATVTLTVTGNRL